MKDAIKIREANEKDQDEIWAIIKEVIAKGDSYVFEPNSPREELIAYWCGSDKHTYVAIDGDDVVGTFLIKDNYIGLGSHVANASYMTKPSEFGRGIGRKMGEHSLGEAKTLGYHAMQFNIVIKTNERAVNLWKSLGFKIVGEVPEVFNVI